MRLPGFSWLRHHVLERPTPAIPVTVSVVQVSAAEGERGLGVRDLAWVNWWEALPVRGMPSFREQRNMPGLEYCATTDSLIQVESRLEARNLLLLDFDPPVDWIVAQPFRMQFAKSSDARSHVPDFLATRAGSSPLVVDVVRDAVRNDVGRVAQEAATAALCEQLGWEYRVVGDVDPVQFANVSLLARYRRQPRCLGHHVALVLEACAAETTIRKLRTLADPPSTVMPTLFHLLWRNILEIDLWQRWTLDTCVRTTSR